MSDDQDIVLNVTRLAVLRELAHRGSIAAVAEALWLTPSAVSQQLSALERETGMKMLERAGRGVRLTTAGTVLARHSDNVFQALDEARSALRALQTVPSGRLRLASFPSVVRILFPPVMARMRERFPSLVIEIEDLEGQQSLEAVRLGHADVAVIDDLTWAESFPHEGIRVEELFATPLVAVFHSTHRWSEGSTVAWADLASEAQVTDQRSALFARSVEAECAKAGFQPLVRSRVHDASAMLAIVEGGEMIAVLPELQLLGQPHAVQWRALVPTVERRLLAVTRVGQEQYPAVQAVMDALSAVSEDYVAGVLPRRAART